MKSEYNKCPKCGFKDYPKTPLLAEPMGFAFQYKDRCYTGCSWADDDIVEHLHVICPVCGFTVGVQGCNDYKELKEKKSASLKPWTGLGTLNNKATSKPTHSTTGTTRRYVTGQGYVEPPKPVDSDGWDTSECPQCPMAKEKGNEPPKTT